MTSDQLITTTAWLFGVDTALLLSGCRAARVAEARHALAWALRHAGWSLESIGDLLGRDHTSVIYGIKAIERKRRQSPQFAERLGVLRTEVEPPFDWKARVVELEERIAALEALLPEQARRRAA